MPPREKRCQRRQSHERRRELNIAHLQHARTRPQAERIPTVTRLEYATTARRETPAPGQPRGDDVLAVFGRDFQVDDDFAAHRVGANGTLQPWITIKANIYQIATNAAGDVFAATYSGDVVRVDHDGTARLMRTGFGLGRLVAITTDEAGDVYAGERGGSGRILKMSADGSRQVVATITGAHFYGLSVDGRFLYAADLAHRQLIRIALPAPKS